MRYVLWGILLLVLYLVAWPTAVEPVAWQPDPQRGDLTPNAWLATVRRVDLRDATGPEDVAVAPDGTIYTGVDDGRILRVDPDTGEYIEIADTGGRPLGLDWESRGRLIIADAEKGLLGLNVVTGNLEVLATEAGGRPFGFADDVDVGADGLIYFSDASDRFGYQDYTLDLLESAGNGRLLSYDPATGEVRTLLDGLQFANGVAVSPDASYVLVVETGRYRLHRHWLRGERMGTTEVFIDRLPGFPDGVSSDGRGTFWIAMPAPRNPLLDQTADRVFLRRMIARLPGFLHPGPERHAMVIGVDRDGVVTHNLQEGSGRPFAMITSVEEVNEHLYLGSLHEEAFGIYRLAGP